MCLSLTHIDSGGVKGAFVGDAGIAISIGELAVGQQAPPIVHYGLHRGGHDTKGRGRS